MQPYLNHFSVVFHATLIIIIPLHDTLALKVWHIRWYLKYTPCIITSHKAMWLNKETAWLMCTMCVYRIKNSQQWCML